jgi:hypothetical protein
MTPITARRPAMGIRKPLVLLASLALIAAGAKILTDIAPTLKAAQESGGNPTARLIVASHHPRVLFSTAEDGDSSRFLRTQEALIRSRLVVSSALRDPKIAQLPSLKGSPDPVAWVGQSLQVTNPKDTELLEFSLAPNSGLGGADQATIINAVVRAYMDEVVNVDSKRRTQRHQQLKKLRDTYSQVIKVKREAVRKLSETFGSDDQPPAALDSEISHRLYSDLRTRRLQLRLEQAEAETLLERRKKADGAASEPARKEIAQLEDRVAILTASQKVVDEEMERLIHQMHGAARRELALKGNEEEIAQMEEVMRKIGAEVEALNIEIMAPSRIKLVDEAVATGR